MKKLETLRRFYHKLTPVERVNLVLEAQKRDDHTEVDVLEHACPVGQSAAYEARVIVIADIAMLMIIQLLACAVFIVHLAADLAREPDPPSDLDPFLRSILQRQAAIWRGFSAWCSDIGHDPRQVLHYAPIGTDKSDPAFFLVHSQIDAIERRSGDPQNPFPDPHQVDAWRQVFAHAFQLAKLEELV